MNLICSVDNKQINIVTKFAQHLCLSKLCKLMEAQIKVNRSTHMKSDDITYYLHIYMSGIHVMVILKQSVSSLKRTDMPFLLKAY